MPEIKSRRTTPPRIRFIRLAMGVLSWVAPGLAVAWLYRLWFFAPRFPEPAREARYRQSARQELLEHDPGPVSVSVWGEGPAVLLIHGWSGRGMQLGAMVAPLVDRGYRVITFDAPGHGRSPGRGTNAFMVRDIVLRLAQRYGAFHCIVGHSFGALCTVMALARGVPATRVVTIGSPTQLPWLLDRFFRYLRVPDAVVTGFQRRAEREFGADVWQQASADHLAQQLSVPALIIHDRDDREVACHQSEILARAWSGSRLLITEGLGHRRILRDPGVITAISDFVTAQEPPDPLPITDTKS